MDSSGAMHAGAGGFFFWNDNPQHFSLSVGPTLRLTPTGRRSSSLKRGESHKESSDEPFTFSTCVRGTCTHEATDCPSVSIMFTIRTTISNKTVGSATNESFRSSGEPTTHVKQIHPPQQNLAPPVVKQAQSVLPLSRCPSETCSHINGASSRAEGLFLLIGTYLTFPITVAHKRRSRESYVLTAQRVCVVSPCVNWLMTAGTLVEPAGDRVRGVGKHSHV